MPISVFDCIYDLECYRLSHCARSASNLAAWALNLPAASFASDSARAFSASAFICASLVAVSSC
jgi:hypothetical protein